VKQAPQETAWYCTFVSDQNPEGDRGGSVFCWVDCPHCQVLRVFAATTKLEGNTVEKCPLEKATASQTRIVFFQLELVSAPIKKAYPPAIFFLGTPFRLPFRD